MSERDDFLRRQLGWTGPEESDYEPPVVEPTFTPAATPLPTRPPVDYVPSDPPPTAPASVGAARARTSRAASPRARIPGARA